MLFWIGAISLVALFIGSAFLSTIAYKKQQAIKLTKSKIRHYKRKADELTDIRNILLRTDEDYESILIIQTMICNYTKKAFELDQTNENLKKELDQENFYLDNYNAGKRDNEIEKAFDSDSEIESANIRLNNFARILLKAKKTGAVSPAKCADIARRMQKLRLDIEVESHLKQARSYLANDDRVLAQSHLKQAKEALRGSPLEFPEKNQRIKDIADEIKTVMRSLVGTSADTEMTETESSPGETDAEEKPKKAPEKPAEDTNLKKKF